MTETDHTVLRLKGYNCLIKFIDGEELYLKVDDLNDEQQIASWLDDVEISINRLSPDAKLPFSRIAIRFDSIKYIQII